LSKYFDQAPHIIDFGAGDGRVLLLLRRIFGTAIRLTALDIKFDIETKKLFEGNGINAVESMIEDFRSDAFPKADVIIMTQVIEHLWDPNKVLSTFQEILKSEGWFSSRPPIQSPCAEGFRETNTGEDSTGRVT